MKSLSKTLLLLFVCQLLISGTTIIISGKAAPAEQLAAKELRRYLYHRTGYLAQIIQKSNLNDFDAGSIVIGEKRSFVINEVLVKDLKGKIHELNPQEYLITSVPWKKSKIMLITGGDEYGVLYGTYRYLETLGIQFNLHGDVIPDEKIEFRITDTTITGKPLFALRGIQPFHDFPEGPDWWDLDDYKVIIGQLPKMGMNFIGFHTYPEPSIHGFYKAEPLVWIGQKNDINYDGTVKSAYPVTHFYTFDSTWGYWRKKTSDFSFGASQFFDSDYYGATYMKNISEWPHSDNENISIFNDYGRLIQNSFSFAKRIGVKTCIGTETPLVIPESVKKKLTAEGKDINDEKTRTEMYEGIFTRIMKLHPLDYYWFWTPEMWTWENEKDEDVKNTEKDLRCAITAASNLNAPFILGTCGWVLGPSKDRTAFDKSLPKDMPFSCINREVGFSPIEPGFKSIQNRPKWAISWIEDDPALTVPQLWARRVRKDAVDAYSYGCTGLMGIHWRTEILSPAFGVLAKAGWEFGNWKDKGTADVRDLPVDDFYRGWSAAQFGKEEIGNLFSKIDGGPLYIRGKTKQSSNIQRPADWREHGPGGVKLNKRPWSEVKENYRYVDEFASFEPDIRGAGNKERFQYWLNAFRYIRSMAETGCILGELDSLATIAKKDTNGDRRAQLVNEKIIPLKAHAEEKWGEMVTLLLQFAGTTGDMGTIANLEMHSLGELAMLTKYDSLIAGTTGAAVPQSKFWKEYRGASRLIVPTKRNLLEPGENLRIKAIILSGSPVKEAKVYWRTLGLKVNQSFPLSHVTQGVYSGVIPATAFRNKDIEYYIEVTLQKEKLFFPSNAPQSTQSVVIW